MSDIDKTLEGDCDTVKVGQAGPIHVPLTDALSGEGTTLNDYLKEGNSVVLILLRHYA